MLRTLLQTLLIALSIGLFGCASAPKPSAAVSATPVKAEISKAVSSKIFDLPHLQRELENGLQVIVVKAPTPGVVSLQIPLQTGSRNEIEEGKTGFAHFFEHMMFRGTPKYPSDAYSAVIKAAGADQNAYTDNDLTNYYLNFTPEDLEKILEVEADRFQNLKYSEEQFRTEALAIKGEYLKNSANPMSKAFERISDLAYTTHTYKHTTMGFLKDIENMPNQMDYAKTFFDRWYRPEYATVIVTGDVELESTFELVKKYFGTWQRGNYSAEIPVEPALAGPKYEHSKWEGPTLPWILSTWRGPAFSASSSETAALMLAREIYFGETSDLYQKLVVTDQVVDQLFAFHPDDKDPGLFGIATRLGKSDAAAQVVAETQKAIIAARTQLVGAQKLAETKSRAKYGFASGLNSAASIASTLARFVHFERDAQTLNKFYASFDKVTADDIRAAANRLFIDSNRVTVSISNDDSMAGANTFKAIDSLVAAQQSETAALEAPIKAKRVLSRHELASYAWSASEIEFSVPTVELPSDSPLVDIQWQFLHGSAYDPVGKKGLAALTAAMITEGGSSQLSYKEIKQALFPFAASLSAKTDKEQLTISATVHKDVLQDWYEIVHQQLFEPGFREEDFSRLKQQQINAIRTTLRSNNDEELGKELLYNEIYGSSHAYGNLTLGKAKDLESITLEDVKQFHREHFLRPYLVVGLAGGFNQLDRNRILGDLARIEYDEKLSPNVPQEPVKPSDLAFVAPAKQRSATVVQKETSAVAVSFGMPINVSRSHPDWIALWLARSWLGEHRNSSAHLYNRIRETRGMNYGDYAYNEYFPNGMYLMQPEPGYSRRHDLFQVWLRPLRSNNDALFATRVAVYELDKLIKNGLDQQSFDNSKAFLQKFVSQLTSTQRKLLGNNLDSQFHKTKPFVEYVREQLDALTLDQTNSAIKKHLSTEGLHFVFVGKDADQLAKRLAQNAPSPITYNTDKPAELLAEDKVIEKLSLKLSGKQIKVVAAKDLFE